MRFAAFLLSAAVLPAMLSALPAAAQQPGVPAPEAARAQAEATPRIAPPSSPGSAREPRYNQLLIAEGDPCPPSNDEQLTICVVGYRDAFRIPENLRDNPNDPRNQSWTNQAIALSYVGASGIGSCSPAGPGGAAGCQQQLINQYVAERRTRDGLTFARLIEEARQERLGGINAAAAEEELGAAGPRRVQEIRIREGQQCPPSTEAVILVCRTPSGQPAPLQPPGNPQFPTTGVTPQVPAPAPQN